jgi:hypothetical protein
MSSAGDRLVGTFMQPYAEPLSWSEGEEDRPLGGAELPEAYRVFNGRAWWIVWKS